MTHLSGFQRAMQALDKYGVPRLNPGGTRNLSLPERIDLLGRSVPEIMGAKAVADLLGTTTSNLDRQAGLPIPITRIDSGRVWLAEDVQRFAEERNRRRAAK